MKLSNFFIVSLVTLALVFGGCSKDETTSPETEQNFINPVTGVFVDSAVSGLSYRCSSGASGITNDLGEFTCESGDTVSFSLGSILLGEVAVAEVITPQTLFPDNEEAALNFAQLIQTLDSDNDPSNGITIDIEPLVELDIIDFTIESFDELIQTVLGEDVVYVSEDEAKNHLNETFATLEINSDGTSSSSEDSTDETGLCSADNNSDDLSLSGLVYCIKVDDATNEDIRYFKVTSENLNTVIYVNDLKGLVNYSLYKKVDGSFTIVDRPIKESGKGDGILYVYGGLYGQNTTFRLETGTYKMVFEENNWFSADAVAEVSIFSDETDRVYNTQTGFFEMSTIIKPFKLSIDAETIITGNLHYKQDYGLEKNLIDVIPLKTETYNASVNLEVISVDNLNLLDVQVVNASYFSTVLFPTEILDNNGVMWEGKAKDLKDQSFIFAKQTDKDDAYFVLITSAVDTDANSYSNYYIRYKLVVTPTHIKNALIDTATKTYEVDWSTLDINTLVSQMDILHTDGTTVAENEFYDKLDEAKKLTSTMLTLNSVISFDEGSMMRFYESWMKIIDSVDSAQNAISLTEIEESIVINTFKTLTKGDISGFFQDGIVISEYFLNLTQTERIKELGRYYIKYGYVTLKEYNTRKKIFIEKYNSNETIAAEEFLDNDVSELSRLYILQQRALLFIQYGMKVYQTNTNLEDGSWLAYLVKRISSTILSITDEIEDFFELDVFNDLVTKTISTAFLIDAQDRALTDLARDATNLTELESAFSEIWQQLLDVEKYHSFYREATQNFSIHTLIDTGFTFAQTDDVDNDGMSDAWEVTYGLNPLVNDASLDSDNDGMTNLQEYEYGTNPFETTVVKVTSLSPLTVTQNEDITFTITGESLPSTLSMSLQGSSRCESLNYVSATIATIVCTPYETGTMDFYIATKPLGDAISSDVTLQVEVAKAPTKPICDMPKDNHTLASLLFNLDIADATYDNPGLVKAEYLMEPYDHLIPGVLAHAGTDFRSKNNTEAGLDEVYSLTAGTVVRAENGTNYGIVGIQTKNKADEDIVVFYAHLDSTPLKVPDTVEIGTLIGLSGKLSGIKDDIQQYTLSHLHIEYSLGAGTSMLYKTSCGGTECTKTQIEALTNDPIELLSISCTPANTAPTVTAQTITVEQESQNNTITLTATDADTTDTLTYTVTQPTNGTLSGTAPNLTYTPTAGYSGTDSFTFKVNDGTVDSNVATVSITVNTVVTGTITHNGTTYGTVTSPYTGKIWLDRNLGASQVCTALNDTDCYGDYYQWGRDYDGHQTSTSVTTSTQALDINSAGSSFIKGSSDWTSTDSDGMLRTTNWSKIDGSSVCPTGFRVPTITELEAETINSTDRISNYTEVFNSFLKFPSAGHRNNFSASVSNQGSICNVWSSNLSYSYPNSIYFSSSIASVVNDYGRADAFSVRCIEDITPQNTIPTATAQIIIVEQGSIDNNIILMGSDADTTDTLTYTIVTNPTNGTLRGTGPNLTYTPTAGYSGSDSFTYKVNDGMIDSNVATVNITVNATPTAIITHNGTTYNIVTSPYTGKIWLDRNLGASQVCTAYNDSACYGDYYQWGRNYDGHEKSNSATTATQATDINSAGSSFITSSSTYSYDWAQNVDSDGTLRSSNWNKTDGSSICPIGFRVPTNTELIAETTSEGVANKTDAFNNFLKFPSAGTRSSNSVSSQGSGGVVWSSSVSGSDSYRLNFFSNNADADYYSPRNAGFSVRCLKD